jgi:hypothetical protein
MHRVRAAALTELFEFETFFDRFFVLVSAISDRFTLGTLELGHVVLGHIKFIVRFFA